MPDATLTERRIRQGNFASKIFNRARIRAAYEMERVEFGWRRGDLLMLDNMLVAHGRNPFEGKRRVIVAMGEGFDLNADEEKLELEECFTQLQRLK